MIELIKEYVNQVYNLDILKNTRKRNYVEARCLYYKLCRELTKESLSNIGESVGRDHSGVIHSLNNVLQDSYAYIVFENIKLKNKLHKKTEVLRLLPKLETIYNNLNDLTEKNKQLVSKRNEMHFDTIAKCLNRVEEIIETETV